MRQTNIKNLDKIPVEKLFAFQIEIIKLMKGIKKC